VPGQPGLVAKVYHQPTAGHVAKLEAMLANPPADPMTARGGISIAWPVDRLWTVDEPARCLGYLMPRVDQARPLFDVYNPGTRLQVCPLFHHGYLLRTARNLAAAVRAVHERGHVIGDLNESNILVNSMALVTLVDTDSFQVRHQGRVYRCPVGKPEYSPPELQQARFADFDRGPEQDAFALAVLIFQLLMQGIHPFAGRFTGQGEPAPLEERIAAGHWPYARSRPVPYAPNPHAPPFDVLPPGVQDLLRRCFEEGHVRSVVRPDAAGWQEVLQRAEEELTTCPVSSQHVYHRGLAACPWCALARTQGRDPFPTAAALPAPAAPSQPAAQVAPPPPPARAAEAVARPLLLAMVPTADRTQPSRPRRDLEEERPRAVLPPRRGPASHGPVLVAAGVLALLVLATVVVLVLVLSDQPVRTDRRAEEQRPAAAKEEPAAPVQAPVEPPRKRSAPVQAPVVPPVQPPVRPAPAQAQWKPPALPVRSTLRPPPLKGDRVVVALPSTCTDLAVGGGGRYLILALPGLRKLAVFDANRAEVARYLSLTDDDVKFAAGITKLVVALPRARRIERYDLETGRREAQEDLPDSVSALCMGSASHGPVLVREAVQQPRGGQGGVWFLDPQTLRRVPLETDRPVPGDGAFFRAAADGTVFTFRNGVGGEPHTVTVVAWEGGRAVVRTARGCPSSVLVPGPTGQWFYSGWAVYNAHLQPLFPRPVPRQGGKPFLPAAHGNDSFFVRLDYRQWDQLGGALTFFQKGQAQPFSRIENVEGVTNEQIAYGKLRDRLCHDQRVHFLPGAKLVVSIPAANDRLVLYRFDAEKALAESGQDYLYAASQPPAVARRGTTWSHVPVFKSSTGGVKVRLDSGPRGMTLSKGELSWKVPADFAETEATVILSAQDAGGSRCLHPFTIRLGA
jgi:hypothetical protein